MKSKQAGGGNEQYQLKPKLKEKFRPAKAKEIIQEVLNGKFKTATFSGDINPTARDIADQIKWRLKELNLPRYKFIVHCILGQQKGQGVRIGNRCFWDYDTDYCASETFINDSLFCMVTVYGIYLY